MESNWRYNVWDKFGPDSGHRLFARLRAGIYAGKWIAEMIPGTPLIPVYTVTPGSLPVLFTVTFSLPSANRFPYLFSVDPD